MKTKEEIKEITLYETPETDEAIKLLKTIKSKYFWIRILHYIFSIAVLLNIILMFQSYENSGTFMLVSLYCLIVSISLYIKLLKPYIDLYKIAKHNDQIRNDERIRFKERLRLEKELITNKNLTNKPLKKEIDKTINELKQ